jgi:hypothetical protein
VAADLLLQGYQAPATTIKLLVLLLLPAPALLVSWFPSR